MILRAAWKQHCCVIWQNSQQRRPPSSVIDESRAFRPVFIFHCDDLADLPNNQGCSDRNLRSALCRPGL